MGWAGDISVPHPTMGCPRLMPSPRLGLHLPFPGPLGLCLLRLLGWAGGELTEQTLQVGDGVGGGWGG